MTLNGSSLIANLETAQPWNRSEESLVEKSDDIDERGHAKEVALLPRHGRLAGIGAPVIAG